MNWKLLLISMLVCVPAIAQANVGGAGDTNYAVVAYCNNQALEHLNAYVRDGRAQDYVSEDDQFDILDKQFTNCLSHEGYELRREQSANAIFMERF